MCIRDSYQSTNYQRGDDIYNMYSHAEGQVMAKVPRRLTFYLEKNKRREEATGRGIWGLSIKIGAVSYTHLDVYKRQGNGRTQRKLSGDTLHGGGRIGENIAGAVRCV